MESRQLLYQLVESTFDQDKIQEISFHGTGSIKNWIFNFKPLLGKKIFLEEYAKAFWEVVHNNLGYHVQIGGMEAGALPLLAALSLRTPKNQIENNIFYIRKSRKKSDLANLIEGKIENDVPVILIDDILNSGDTFLKQIIILEELGCRVSAVFVCLRFRDVSFYKQILEKGITIYSLFDLNDFAKTLPVNNLESKLLTFVPNNYRIEYKVNLTDKPNLYIVVPKSAPVFSDGFVYMGVDGGYFYCINAKTGSIEWKYRVFFGSGGKYIFSSPQVYEDKVIFGAYDGNLYCLNKFTGKKEWIFSEADWIGSSPCIDETKGVVYIGLEFGLFNKTGGVVAISIQTGEIIWRNYEMTGLTHATPVYSKKYDCVICGCNDGYVYMFNAKTGKINWKYKTNGEIKYGAVFDDKRNLVVIGSLDGGVYLFAIKEGVLFYKFEAAAGFYSTPVIYKDKILVGSLDKCVYCYDISTKKEEWKYRTNGRIFSSPTLDLKESSVLIGSNDGVLYELDVTSGNCISKTQFSERLVNKAICFYEGSIKIIFVSTHAGELYKIVKNKLI